MKSKFIAVGISVLLLSLGWLGVSGLPLLVALVPLLYLSGSSEDSRAGWWSTFRYALLTFVAWNVATVWWIWFATPIGPVVATITSTTLSMAAFMTFHTVSKRASKTLSYTLLISGWIALEYWYTMGTVSWPWLLLGNGFSSDIWAIQWYEYTGLFGGSLWVLLTNILIYESWVTRRRKLYIASGVVALLPLLVSAVMYIGFTQPDQGQIQVSLVQPNIHFGREQHATPRQQGDNLIGMLNEVPTSSDFIVMPECALPDITNVATPMRTPINIRLQAQIRAMDSDASLVAGVSTIEYYKDGEQSETVRQRGSTYFDVFNSAIYIPQRGRAQIHHKSKLVVGTESLPFIKIFKHFESLIIDLGGSLGQLGRGTERVVFHDKAASVGAAICYEALYGAYFGEFVANGAEAMFVISNDCWWDNTPGYRHLFSMSAIRAVEHRRAIARSANTGISGFISARGDRLDTLGWDKQGVLTDNLPLNHKITFYTRYGDYIARISIFMAILSLLNYMVLRVRRRHHIV